MNWEAIGAIGEVLGAVGVITTLVYLSIQLRQNTKALQSSSWRAVQDAEQRFDEFLSRDHHLLNLWVKGRINGIDSFDDEAEKFQFLLIGKQLIDQVQTHHYQYENGMIEPEWWQSWVTQLGEELEFPGFREVLIQRRPHLRPSFRKFVDDELLGEGDV